MHWRDSDRRPVNVVGAMTPVPLMSRALLLIAALSATAARADTPGTIPPKEVSGAVQLFQAIEYRRDAVTPGDYTDAVPALMAELDPEHAIFLRTDPRDFSQTLGAGVYHQLRFAGDAGYLRPIFVRWQERWRERAARIAGWAAGQRSAPASFDPAAKRTTWPASLAEADAYWDARCAVEANAVRLTGASAAEAAMAVARRYAQIADTVGQRTVAEEQEQVLSTVASLYDPHSSYIGPATIGAPDEAARHWASLGFLFKVDGLRCTVTGLIPGGPAALSGRIHRFDEIMAVSQDNGPLLELAGMTEHRVATLLRGTPGSTVTLAIAPRIEAGDGILKYVTLRRELATAGVERATAGVVSIGRRTVGVVEVPSLYGPTPGVASASADVRALLGPLQRQHVNGLVLDLRHNEGGYLTEAIALTKLFVDASPIVWIKRYDGHVENDSDTKTPTLYHGPLVVLVDNGTASGAEIVAGTLQAEGRALIVGTPTTAGAGTVQQFVRMRDVVPALRRLRQSGLVKVTIEKFYLPDGNTTQLRGVKSDLVVAGLEDEQFPLEADRTHTIAADTLPVPGFEGQRISAAVVALLKGRSDERQQRLPEMDWLRRRAALLNQPVPWPTAYEAWRQAVEQRRAAGNALRQESRSLVRAGYPIQIVPAAGVAAAARRSTTSDDALDDEPALTVFDPALSEAERLTLDLADQSKPRGQ